MENGPELWDALLDAVGVDGAVISGGAVRDYILGVEPKDYDIFIPGTRDDMLAICERLSIDGLGNQTVLPYQGGYEGYDDPLQGVTEGEILGYPANLILNERMNTGGPDHLVAGFDYAITQGYWTKGASDIVLTDGAVEDFTNRTATMLTLRCYTRSLRRIDKYTVRNGPILTLVDPFQESFQFT